MSALLLAAAASIYLSVGFSQLLAIKQGRDLSRRTLLISLWIATILSIYPTYQSVFDGYALYLGVFHVLSIVTLSTMLVLLVMALRYPTQNLGALIGPVTALCLLGLLQSTTLALPLSELTSGMVLHIVFSIAAYGFLTSAVFQALLLSIQNKHLHERRLTGLITVLPPLQTMEVMLFSFIWLGFITLGIAIGTGFTYVDNLLAQHLVHKTVLSIIAWGFFGFLLIGKYIFGWRGQRATRLTIIGFILLMLGYFGSSFVLQYILH